MNRRLDHAVRDLHVVGFSRAHARESQQGSEKNRHWKTCRDWLRLRNDFPAEVRHLLASFEAGSGIFGSCEDVPLVERSPFVDTTRLMQLYNRDADRVGN
jgi:hypothetical protein